MTSKDWFFQVAGTAGREIPGGIVDDVARLISEAGVVGDVSGVPAVGRQRRCRCDGQHLAVRTESLRGCHILTRDSVIQADGIRDMNTKRVKAFGKRHHYRAVQPHAGGVAGWADLDNAAASHIGAGTGGEAPCRLTRQDVTAQVFQAFDMDAVGGVGCQWLCQL